MIYAWIHRCYLVNTCKLWEKVKCVSQDSSLEYWTFNWKVISLSLSLSLKKKVIKDPKVPAHLNEKREVRWGWARGHYRLQWNGRKNWASPEAEQKDPKRRAQPILHLIWYLTTICKKTQKKKKKKWGSTAFMPPWESCDFSPSSWQRYSIGRLWSCHTTHRYKHMPLE